MARGKLTAAQKAKFILDLQSKKDAWQAIGNIDWGQATTIAKLKIILKDIVMILNDGIK